MSRDKANAPNRHIIIDLSWPKGYSINAGVDKNSYLGSEFALTFPTVDDIMKELTRLGPGAHLYKIDISRVFRHLNIDLRDYDLLGLHWDGAYVDTCLLFSSRHGSQNFQCVSDTLHYTMHRQGFPVINYIDDFIRFSTPNVASQSFACLTQLLECLGLTISQKKLIPPTTSAICLGMLIDTKKGSISIPDEKLSQIRRTISEWLLKSNCTKKELQSLLGQLL